MSNARKMTKFIQASIRSLLSYDVLIGAILLPLLALIFSLAVGFAPRSVSYTMHTLPVMLPTEQMHEPEQLPGWDRTFRWTEGEATIEPANPGGALFLRLVLGGGPQRTLPIRLHTNHRSLSFTVTPSPRTYALLLPPSHGERVHLSIDSPILRERGRSLGVMLSDIRLAGNGTLPLIVILSLIAASISGYGVLRAGSSPILSKGIATLVIVALQALSLLWYAGGGWQYGLYTPLLWVFVIACVGAMVIEMICRRGKVRYAPTSYAPTRSAPTHQTILRDVRFWFIIIVALIIRIPWIIAPDPVGDLELAARRMWFLHNDGLAGAYTYHGDYMPLRLYLLSGLSHLVSLFGGGFHDPLPPHTLFLIKLPSLIADLITIAIIFIWSHSVIIMTPHSVPRFAKHSAIIIALLYALSPPVWINVAWWGQVDALLMLPLVGMILLLDQAKGGWSWLCWTIALLIKPQAIVFAPLLYIATIRLHGKRGFAQGAALAVATFVLACVPLVLADQGHGLMQAYLGSVGRFPKLTIGAYNIWHLFTWGAGGDDTRLLWGILSYRMIGMLLVGCAALLVVIALLRDAHVHTRVLAAAVLALSFFMLPTQIHERYLFLSLPLLALGIINHHSHRVIVLCYSTLVITATLNVLGTLDGFVPLAHAFIQSSPLPLICAGVNVVVLMVLIFSMLRDA